MAQCNDKRSKKQTAADDKPEQSLALECLPKKNRLYFRRTSAYNNNGMIIMR